MENDKKIEILVKEVKRLTDENNKLREQYEELVKTMQENSFTEAKKHNDTYKKLIGQLRRENSNYKELNKEMLKAKNRYISEMDRLFKRLK